MKSKFLAVMAFLLLGACGAAPETAEMIEETATAKLVDGVTITNARMILAPVKGNPAAVYFDLTFIGDGDVGIESASVEGVANAMIHQTSEGGHMMSADPITLTSGETFAFQPGSFHIMAMQVSPQVEAGATTNVTINLSDGTQHSFEAEVRAAGEER